MSTGFWNPYSCYQHIVYERQSLNFNPAWDLAVKERLVRPHRLMLPVHRLQKDPQDSKFTWGLAVKEQSIREVSWILDLSAFLQQLAHRSFCWCNTTWSPWYVELFQHDRRYVHSSMTRNPTWCLCFDVSARYVAMTCWHTPRPCQREVWKLAIYESNIDAKVVPQCIETCSLP